MIEPVRIAPVGIASRNRSVAMLLLLAPGRREQIEHQQNATADAKDNRNDHTSL
jgi:hypothetical protein